MLKKPFTITLPHLPISAVPLLGMTLLILGAWIKIPFYPVPFTLQTLSLFFIGLTQSPKNAFLSAIGYLALCSLGLPVFANFATNPCWLTGKTAGYLFAFPIATYLIAKAKPYIGSWGALLCGSSLILCCGWIGLIPWFGPSLAFSYGVVAFIPSELGKMGIAIALLRLRKLRA